MATIDRRDDKYRVRYSVYENGQRKQRNKTFDKARDAKAFAAEIEHAIQTGSYSYSGKLTLAEYLREYFDVYCSHMRPNTLTASRNYMEQHIIPHIGNIQLKALTTLQIQKVYNTIVETAYSPAKYKDINGLQELVSPAKYYSPKTVQNINGVLSTALKKAVKTNLITKNPCDNVTLPKSTTIEYVIPNKEELKAILSSIQKTRFYEAILTTAMLGIRRSEVLGLYWSDISFEDKTVSIRRSLILNEATHTLEVSELKTAASRRTLPLPEALIKVLQDLKEKQTQLHIDIRSPFVFTTEAGTPIRPASLTKCFKSAAAEAGLPKMRLHDLRHTVVTYLLEAGQSPKTVQEFVGHTDARFTLKQYAHVMEESKRQSSKVMNNLFFTSTNS